MTDVPRVPEPPIELEIDPDDERPVDPVEPVDDELPERLADADPEVPEADALDQHREVPLDDDDR